MSHRNVLDRLLHHVNVFVIYYLVCFCAEEMLLYIIFGENSFLWCWSSILLIPSWHLWYSFLICNDDLQLRMSIISSPLSSLFILECHYCLSRFHFPLWCYNITFFICLLLSICFCWVYHPGYCIYIDYDFHEIILCLGSER